MAHDNTQTSTEVSNGKSNEFRTFQSIAKWNLNYMKTNLLGEISGSLGDLGTLLPILIALAQVEAIDLPTTLVVTGLASMLAGAWFGYPLAVQPMKAIAGIVLARGMGLRENISAGLTAGGIVLVVSIVGIQLLLRLIPIPVVRGMKSFLKYLTKSRYSDGSRSSPNHQLGNSIIRSRLELQT